MPATTHSACARSGTGPRCHTDRAGLGRYAMGIPGRYRFPWGARATPPRGGPQAPALSGWPPQLLLAAADAGGQGGRQVTGGGDRLAGACRLGEAADECGADDDPIGEPGDLGRLLWGADTEADSDRQTR